MPTLPELIIEYEKEHAKRVMIRYEKLINFPGMSFPLCKGGDYVQSMENVATSLLKMIEEGRELMPLDQNKITFVGLAPIKGPHPLEEAVWHQAKETGILYRTILADGGEYASWQDALRSVFKTKSEYLIATENHFRYLEKEIEIRDRDATGKDLMIGKPARAKALKAYKEVRDQVADEIFSTDNTSLTKRYKIAYIFSEDMGEYTRLIKQGELTADDLKNPDRTTFGKEVPKTSIFYGCDISDKRIDKKETISRDMGCLVLDTNGHLVYHRNARNMPKVKDHRGSVVQVEKEAEAILIPFNVNTDKATSSIYFGKVEQFKLELILKKV